MYWNCISLKILFPQVIFFSEWVCFTLFLITVLLIITFIHGNSRVVLIDPPQSIRVNALAFLQPSLLWELSSRKQGDYQL